MAKFTVPLQGWHLNVDCKSYFNLIKEKQINRNSIWEGVHNVTSPEIFGVGNIQQFFVACGEGIEIACDGTNRRAF